MKFESVKAAGKILIFSILPDVAVRSVQPAWIRAKEKALAGQEKRELKATESSTIKGQGPRGLGKRLGVLTGDGEPIHVVDEVDEEEDRDGDPLGAGDVVGAAVPRVRHRGQAVLAAVAVDTVARVGHGRVEVPGQVDVRHLAGLGHEVLAARVERDGGELGRGLPLLAELLGRHLDLGGR